jgi:dTDP-4-amino-4,6-dideoxygalactose transaminase
MEIADMNSIFVIEDASQAHLASVNNKPVGTFGDAAAFSFYPTKNMTSGEGGMIVLKNSSSSRTCRLLRNQGMENKYQNEIVGFNLRMTDIHAAIGRCQLKNLFERTEQRIMNAFFLSRNLQTDTIPFIPEGFKHVFHQYTVRINKHRDQFSKSLKKLGIGNEIYYPTPVHKLPSFSSQLKLQITETAAQQVLSLPVYPSLTKRQLNKICDSFNQVMDSMIN